MGENPAALRAAVFSLSSKNLRGGGAFKRPPPSRARVKGSVSTAFVVWKYFSYIKKHLILCLDETKMDLKPLIMLF